MNLIESKVEIIEQEPGLEGVYKMAELAGRTAYKSEDRITEGSAKKFVEALIKLKHGAVAKDFIEGRLEDVKEELSNFAGKEINLQCVLLSKEETASSDSLDISKLINMPIEFEE